MFFARGLFSLACMQLPFFSGIGVFLRKHLQGNLNQRMEKLESSQQSTKDKVHHLQEQVEDLTLAKESNVSMCQDNPETAGNVNQRMEQLESSQQSTKDKVHHLQENVNLRMESLETSQQSTEDKVHHLQEKVEDLTLAKESNVSMCQDNPETAAFPGKLVELIRRDYKSAVLCPFPWCEDELQMELSNIFTRLKIISKKKERDRRTDDIVSMTDVFKPLEECDKPRVVLIEGQPGMGKTTYCQKLAYDWSRENIAPEASFPKVEILLLLKCRDMKTANIEEAISDQLLPQDAEKIEKENFFRFIRCNQSRILLVLDGLDELRQDLFQGFLPLIQGKLFSNTYVMLTARHEAGMKVRRYCDTLFEIVGYTNKDADSYITKYFSNHEDPSLANKLMEKLKRDGQLRELAANPLNTALLCLLCEDTSGTFPSNRTKLYNELVSSALRRYFAKKGVTLNDDEPIEVCADQLNLLGKMALEALLKGQLAFSSEQLKGQSTDFLEFGFLSREASASKIRPKPCYAFTHKTFQEYFAAFYLAHQLLLTDGNGRKALLAQLSGVWRYRQVWSFLMGILTDKSASYDVAASVVESLCASDWDWENDYYEHDDYEGYDTYDDWYDEDDHYNDDICGDDDFYNEDICDDDDHYNEDICGDDDFYNEDMCDDDDYYNEDICNDEDDTYDDVICGDEDDYFPNPYDMNLDMPHENKQGTDFLYNVLCLIDECGDGNNESSSFQRKMVQALGHCLPLNCTAAHSHGPGNIPYSYLFFEYVKSNPKLTRLNLRGDFGELGGTEIVQMLQQPNCRLMYLDMWSTSVSTTILRCLHSNNSLRQIRVPNTKMGDTGAIGFANALKSSSALECLYLDSNDISDSGAAALIESLQFSSALKILTLRNNIISDPGEIPTHVSKSNCTLTWLDLGRNRINDSGAAHLAHALGSQCTALTYLNIDNNKISDSGIQTFAEAIESNWKLTYLNASFNSIGDAGMKSLASSLQSNCNLSKVNLRHNSIGDAGAESLANALQSNCNLMYLNLRHNAIGDAGAESLANALQSNCHLKDLNLRHNAVGNAGAKSIADALQSNCYLTDLNLTRNAIGDAGVECLARALQSNCNLINLDFSLNMLTSSVF